MDGAASGTELAGKLVKRGEGIWEIKLSRAIERLERGALNVSVKDRQGNVARVERTIRVK
jgi:hypothetical protein